MPFGIQVEMAAPSGDSGMAFSESFFDVLEKKISAGRTYRGKVISLEQAFDFTERTGNVKVHRLRPVRCEEVILPETTVDLLDSNLAGFIAARREIKEIRFFSQERAGVLRSSRNGKTHTLH